MHFKHYGFNNNLKLEPLLCKICSTISNREGMDQKSTESIFTFCPDFNMHHDYKHKIKGLRFYTVWSEVLLIKFILYIQVDIECPGLTEV